MARTRLAPERSGSDKAGIELDLDKSRICAKRSRGKNVFLDLHYPIGFIGALFVAVFVTVAWIGTVVVRKTLHSWVHREPRANEMVGFALSSFLVLYGLLLGLLAVAAYQNYATVSDIVDKEASSIAALDRDFAGYPQPISQRPVSGSARYTRYIIEEGWPLQRKGVVPKGGTERVTSIARLLYSFEPSKKAKKSSTRRPCDSSITWSRRVGRGCPT